jgi:hypothetical protein
MQDLSLEKFNESCGEFVACFDRECEKKKINAPEFVFQSRLLY